MEKFEVRDPAEWSAQGHAISNPDRRGVTQSDGDSAMFGRQEGKDAGMGRNYDPAHIEDHRRFFDHYLKGRDNRWDQTPCVHYSVFDLEAATASTRTAHDAAHLTRLRRRGEIYCGDRVRGRRRGGTRSHEAREDARTDLMWVRP